MKFKIGDKARAIVSDPRVANTIVTITDAEKVMDIQFYIAQDTNGEKWRFSEDNLEFLSAYDFLSNLADEWRKLGKAIISKEEKNLKFTFYVTEGTRPDKNPDGDGKGVIPTMTTFVSIGRYYSGKATCDKADYNERQGCLEAIANAVLGGNFDREYEKFLADKKRKYNESCKCKICGRNYYEDEKTGKRTPFTPEDARKHEEWHEQNKKNKRERYLLRKRAKEIAFEEQAQKMAKEIIAENKKEAK